MEASVKEYATKGVAPTAKRIWDDLRTLADALGPFTTEFRTPDWREIHNIADGVDDVAGRLFKLAERVKETPTQG